MEQLVVDNCNNQGRSYEFLYEFFSSKRINARVVALSRRALAYIRSKGWEEYVGLNREILYVMVLDYFTDIYRLKKFHQNITNINRHKIYSYTAYWWIRRKPIQVIDNNYDNEEIVYANEEFMAQLILFEMLETSRDKHYNGMINFDRNGEVEKEFLDTLKYYMKYRLNNVNSLEIALETFEFALKLFQRNQT